MADLSCALLVVGAGPGGYVCAIRAAQLGIDTIIVDSDAAGGTCLNIGCIPSKALIHAADEYYRISQLTRQDPDSSSKSKLGISANDVHIDLQQTINWKNGIVNRLTSGVSGLLKKAGVNSIQGTARFRDGKNVSVQTADGSVNIRARNIVIAAGSEAVELPALPFGGNVLSSTEALSPDSLPRSLAVVGAGYIGLEIGTAYAKLGTRVTLVESAAQILPQYDAGLTRPVLKRLSELGVTVLCQTHACGYDEHSRKLTIDSHPDNSDADTRSTIDADNVLVTVGRRPRLQGWGLTELSLTLHKGFLQIDEHCQTSMRGVYAIGDVTGEPMLAHRAMAQGELVAEVVAGHAREWDKACIPAVCFTDPEIVTVGISPQQAKDTGLAVLVSEFPFRASGRALSVEREDGFIRVLAREDNHAIVGVQGTGAGIAELSSTFSLAIEMGSRLEDIAATVHAHPTLGESFHEACLKSLGHALHI